MEVGLWQVIRPWGWNLPDGTRALVKRDRRGLAFPLAILAMWGHRENRGHLKARKSAHLGTESACTLIFISQPPELYEINICCLSYSLSVVLLQQPKLINRTAVYRGGNGGPERLSNFPVRTRNWRRQDSNPPSVAPGSVCLAAMVKCCDEGNSFHNSDYFPFCHLEMSIMPSVYSHKTVFLLPL